MRYGRIVPMALATAAFSLLLLGALPVGGQAQVGNEPTTTTTAPTPPNTGSVQTCTVGPDYFSGDCVSVERSERTVSSRSSWPPFFGVLIWIVIPLVLAVTIAADRQASVLIAAVLAVVLGWVGLVLVYLFHGSRRREKPAIPGS